MRIVSAFVLLLVVPACSDSGGGSAERSGTTVAESSANEGEGPVGEPGGTSECADATDDVFVDQEPGAAPDQGFLDLVRVEVDDRGDEIAVRWHLSAGAPARATWENGEDGSSLWMVGVVPEGDTVGYSLQVSQNGGEWAIDIVDLEQSAQTTNVSDPADARLTDDVIAATFPTESMTRLGPGSGWYALSEGDGPLDPEFDFALPFTVQDRCPDAEVPVDREPRVDLR